MIERCQVSLSLSALVWSQPSYYLSTYSGLSHDFLTRHDIQSILNFSLSWLAGLIMPVLVQCLPGNDIHRAETIDTA